MPDQAEVGARQDVLLERSAVVEAGCSDISLSILLGAKTYAISSALVMMRECADLKSPSSFASIAASRPKAGVTRRRIQAVAM